MEVIAAQQKKDFEATIARREKELKSLMISLRDHMRQLQEVSAQLQSSEPPQLVNNP
jgi:hypothetical protein